MAYEKTTWESGDVVTSEKLNNIENGVEGSYALIVDAIFDLTDPENPVGSIDKSYNEIKEFVESGRVVVISYTEEHEEEGVVETGTHYERVYYLEEKKYAGGSPFVYYVEAGSVSFYSDDPDEDMTTEEPDWPEPPGGEE